jgi:hypothetical protein
MNPELFGGQIDIFKLVFVAAATAVVFSSMFSSWPKVTRLVFASVFAAGTFVVCLRPEDQTAWSTAIQAIDLAFYSMISGVCGLYIQSRFFPGLEERQDTVFH